jgi:hypothetical protein
MPAPSRTLVLIAGLGIVALATAIVLNFQKKPVLVGSDARSPAASSAHAGQPRFGNSGTTEKPLVDNVGPAIRNPAKAPPTPQMSNDQAGRVTTAPAAPRADYEPPPSKYKNARNPIARRALAGVGSDPESERVWLEAINDPNLPVDERKDLIEDLNEDGISNPAKPTKRDLPLIKSRILLIEQLSPSAMDQNNAAAFKEAYKDLVNMVNRLEP